MTALEITAAASAPLAATVTTLALVYGPRCLEKTR